MGTVKIRESGRMPANNHSRWNTIRARLTLAVVAATLVAGFIINSLNMLHTIQTTVALSARQLDSVATLKAAQVDRWLDDLSVELGLLADAAKMSVSQWLLATQEFPALRNDSEARIRAFFADQQARSQRFRFYYLTDSDGRILIQSAGALRGVIFGETDYFGGESRDLDHEMLTLNGRVAGILVYQPFTVSNNHFVLVGWADLDRLDAIMGERASMSTTSITYLVDSQGRPVTGDNVVDSQGYRRALGGGYGWHIYQNPDWVLGAYRWLPDLQLVLLAEQSMGEIVGGSLVVVVASLTISLLAAGVVAALTLRYVSRSISAPLEDLADKAALIAGGELDMQTNVGRSDEIGQLALAFNSMTYQLRHSIDHLEDRIAARTRDVEVGAKVAREVTTTLDLDELLPLIADETRRSFGLLQVAVWLYSDDNTLRLVAVAGEDRDARSITIDKPDCVLAQCARLNEPVFSEDKHVLTGCTCVRRPAATRSMAALPMMIGSKLIGILDLQSEQPARFEGDDTRVLVSLADQVAVAVRNAQLYARQVRMAEELRELDKMKSQFLASMSHELRTPMNAVLNFTQFVANGMLGPVNERQVDKLNKALASGKHLLSLINDLLDITKIEADMLHLFIEADVDLNEELATVLATVDSMLADKPVTLISHIAPDLPVMVGDRRRLRQVLLNLVSNACKFTQHGSVTVSAEHLGETVCITVQDTGPGIAAEDFDLIFQPFRQTTPGLTQGGTGLGLPISLRLVEAHDGRLWLESEPGTGSTFFIELPVASVRLLQTMADEMKEA